jgi:hypothetical protein
MLACAPFSLFNSRRCARPAQLMRDSAVRGSASRRALAHDGPETQDVRALLKRLVAKGIQKATSGDGEQLASMRSTDEFSREESLQNTVQRFREPGLGAFDVVKFVQAE